MFIVDADVYQSAGISEKPVSSTSRTLLKKILDDNHSVCYCTELRQEWDNHKSNYSLRWRASMFAKKRLIKLEITPDTKEYLEKLDDSKDQRAAIKDSHIIDLAIASKRKVIFSNDKKAKDAFSKLLNNNDKFKKIFWMSPLSSLEDISDYALRNKIIPDTYEI